MAAQDASRQSWEIERKKRLDRLKMEDVWMGAARMLAMRSRCQRRQVGCIVTDRDQRRVLGNGYNGRAAGVDECPGTDPCCLHAEVNALIASGSLEKGKVMFVTVSPCEKCAMMIINSGFSRVIYDEDHENAAGLLMLEQGGVKAVKYRRRAERGENAGERVFGSILDEAEGKIPE